MSIRTITTVLTPATDTNLTTRATVKSVLEISDGSQDGYLDLIIRQASAAAENYCNRAFGTETLQDLVLPDRDNYPYQVPGGFQALQASRWPITAVTSLTEDTTALLAGTDFQADFDKGLFYRLDVTGKFPCSWPALPITLVYVCGYVLPAESGSTLPADVEAGVIEIVKAMWSARTRDPAVRSEMVPELLSTSYQLAQPTGSGLPPSAETMLDNYRVPVVA